jgi:hypothetical protein
MVEGVRRHLAAEARARSPSSEKIVPLGRCRPDRTAEPPDTHPVRCPQPIVQVQDVRKHGEVPTGD